jgi:hypothetical protein
MGEYDHRPTQIEINLHVHGLAEVLGSLIGFAERILHDQRLILQGQQELKVMSQTNQDAIDAANATLTAGLDKLQTDLQAIATELQAAIPPAGTVPTAASIAALQAGVTRLQSVVTAADALVVPPPAPTP